MCNEETPQCVTIPPCSPSPSPSLRSLLHVQAREEQVLSTQFQLEQMESEEKRKRVAEVEEEISRSKKKAKEFLIDQLVRLRRE